MSLLELIAMLFAFNAMTFGDGPIMIVLLQDHLVERVGVISSAQLLYAFTLGRVTPGQANTYVAAIGYMLFGIPGAVLTTLAILLPGYLMLPVLRGYDRLRNHQAVMRFTTGLKAASVGLIFAATLRIAQQSLTEPIGWVVFLVALVLTFRFRWNPIASLVAASLFGVLLHLWG